MTKLYIGVFFLFGLHYSAQESKTVWQKDLKSSTQDFLSAMTSTLDRQLMLAGSSINQKKPQLPTGSVQNKGYDYHAVKLDQNGNKVWDRYFGGTRHDYLMASISTQEGGFLLAGTSLSNQSGEKVSDNVGGSDVWIIRLDENGEDLWQQTLGTSGNDEAGAVVQTTDQGFFVAGNINSHQQLFGSKDVFISKLSKEGKLIQTTVLGGTGLDEVTAMIATEDGGSLIAIYTTSGATEDKVWTVPEKSTGPSTDQRGADTPIKRSSDLLESLMATTTTAGSYGGSAVSRQLYGKSEDNMGSGDYWIVKLDKDGKIEWQKSYGGRDDDRAKAISFTENGYLIAGESRSQSSGNKKENSKEGTDVWMISVDKEGSELWQKNYSFGNRDVVMSLDVIRKTGRNNQSEDRGYLIGGYTQAEEKIEADDEKFWMLYLDPKGKEEWRKHVEGKSRKKEERLVSAKLQYDGTFLLAGTSAEELGQENWKVVKLGSKELEDLVEKQEIRIYPNPVDDYAYVEIGLEFQEAEIALYDMTGRQIQTIKTKNKVTKINTASLPQGVYLVAAKTENTVVNAKIVKK